MPALSRHAAAGDLTRLKSVFADTARLTLFIIGPATVGLLVLGQPIIAAIFQRGQFTADMTVQTSRALAGFALGLPAAAGIRLVVPVYYALGDSRTPVKVAAVSLVAFVAGGLALMGPLAHFGLALAISAATASNFGLLLLLLRRRLGRLGLRAVTGSALRVAAASAAMGAAAWGLDRWILGSAVRAGGVERVAAVLGVVLAAALVYFAVAALLRCPELGELAQALRGRGRRNGSRTGSRTGAES
jgi:putative peptidoglycan lipid II flippase